MESEVRGCLNVLFIQNINTERIVWDEVCQVRVMQPALIPSTYAD